LKHTLLFLTLIIAILNSAISQTASSEKNDSFGIKVKNKSPRAVVQVTFQVNMVNETVSADGVHLAGSWQSDPWDPSEFEMTDTDGDNIYTATIDLESGTEYYYLFFNGNAWGTQETVPEECLAGLGEPDYRNIFVGSSNTTLDPVCFNYCVNCAPFYDVTLEVNMQYQTVSPDGVYVEGTFAYYTGLPMTNSDGEIWTITLSMMEGSIPKYRFYNGIPHSGGTIEGWATPYPPCVGFEPARRYFAVPAYDTTLQVCFEYCSNCPNLLISEVASPIDDPWSGYFIELYNAGNETIDFNYLPIWFLQYSPNPQWQERLTGSLAAGEKFVIGSYDFDGIYGFTPNLETGDIYASGNDAFFLYMGNEDSWLTQIDAFGSVDEFGDATTVDYVDTKAVRLRSVTEPSPVYIPEQWHFPLEATIDDMTPGAHCEDVDWTGSLGNNCNTKGNWGGLNGYIPDASYNGNIPNVGSNPSVSAETATNNITVETGANLILAPDKWLTVFGDLDISAGNMTIQANADEEGSLITYGNVTGQAEIEKNMSDGAWHLVSSPVSNETADVFFSEYLQTYDEPADEWVDVESETDPLNPMQGYALWGVVPLRSTTYTFSGTPNTGSQSFSFTNLNTGWNLIGNPYPSGIDWDSVVTDLPAGLNNAIYYLDAATGTYKSYIDGAGDGSSFIPPMQGFWVSASADGSLTFDNADRTHQGSNLYYKNEEILTNYIELLAARDSDFDQTFIRFRSSASAEFDGKYDAYKLLAPNQDFPQLFTYAGNDILSVNQLPETETMDLGFHCGRSGTYTILLAEINGVSKCLIEDLKTGQTQDLKMGSYTFDYTAGESDKRFKLHFGPTSVSQTAASENILIYSKGKQIIVSSKNVIQNSQLQITDLSGRILLERTIDNQQYFSVDTGLQSGVYLVTLSGQGSVKTEKVIIN
jgi:hypothetical protein